MRASRRDSGELFAGLRGTLAMAGVVPEEDAFSLIAKRSEILGFAEFGGDRHAIAHWGHCDAGGTWTQDGEEHLLAWLQVHVLASAPAERSAGHEPKRLLPIASTLTVLRDALEHVGTLTLTEAVAVVPLGVMADPIGRLAVGRDWLLSTPGLRWCHEVIVTVEAGGSASKIALDRLVPAMACVGEEALRPMTVHPAPKPYRPEPFLQRDFTRGSVQLRAMTQLWSVDFAAWAIELAARACHALGVRETVLISVRRGQALRG